MNNDLPTSVEINSKNYKIRNDCDYRVVLDCLEIFEDKNLSVEKQCYTSLFVFYDSYEDIDDYFQALTNMIRIIDCKTTDDFNRSVNKQYRPQPKVMSWVHDFEHIAPAVNRVLGYDIRTPGRYTHWWTFVGAYMEIGECAWSTFVSIRLKKIKGEKLEDWERKIYREHRESIDLPLSLTNEENDWLEGNL